MPQTSSHNYLDPRTLAAIGPIELRARMIVEGMMTGMHRSPMEGVSVEFAQHRQYTPGDDTRFLDWKVYGKTDKTGSNIIENKVSGPDFNATIAHAMGLKHDQVLMSPNRRPFKFGGKEGAPVTKLFV